MQAAIELIMIYKRDSNSSDRKTKIRRMSFEIEVYTTEEVKEMEALLGQLATTNLELAKMIHALACGKAIERLYDFPLYVVEGYIPLKPALLFMLCIANNGAAYEIAAKTKHIGEPLPPEGSRFWEAQEMYKKHFPESEREFIGSQHEKVVRTAIEFIMGYIFDVEIMQPFEEKIEEDRSRGVVLQPQGSNQ